MSKFRLIKSTAPIVGSFVIVMLVLGTSVWVLESNRRDKRRAAVADMTNQVSGDIRDYLYHSLSTTYTLAAVIRQSNGKIPNFKQLGRDILAVYRSISSLQIAPNGIISDIVPLNGNEKAIGHNVLEDTRRNKEALLALHTRALTLAGPFELVQGGKGAVGRLPIFLRDHSGSEYFWGFSAVLMKAEDFLREARIQRLSEKGCSYELYRIHPDTGEKDVFSSTGGTLKNPVSQVIQVPNGQWILSVEPAGGWFSLHLILVEALAVLLLSTFAALAVWWLVRQPIVLQKMVDDRTIELTEANERLQSEITERVIAEEALKASENKLRSIFSSLTDILLILDENGCILEVAPTSSELSSSVKEMSGKMLAEVLPPEKAELFLSTIRNCLSSGGLVSVDYPLPFEGREVWHAANVSPLSPTTVVWSATDITHRKKSEEERLKLEMQILHAQKLESLGVLAGGIAHDFNNILTAIIANAELAQKRLPSDSPANECLQRTQKAAARAADLCRQMLAYSGKGRFVIEDVDINSIVEEMMNILEVSITKKTKLRCKLHQPLPQVTVDATQIRQVIMNLVINASEAIGEEGGFIAIRTGTMNCSEASHKNQVPGEQLPEGECVFIEVSDTGCGMSEEVVAKLFDPFFTTKFTGRGLGMAAVLGIVRSHKGAILVDSEMGKGSTFRVILPQSGHSGKESRLNESPLHWKGEGTILLVEDEVTVRSVATEMLVELGFHVVVAEDGEQALKLYSPDEISIVLLDLTMPNMDGEECLRELRKLNPTQKVIMTSGYDGQEVMQQIVDEELTTFIQKPYNLSDLRRALQRHLA